MHEGEIGTWRHTGASQWQIIPILRHELQNQRLHGRRITSVVAAQEARTDRNQAARHQFGQRAGMQWSAQPISSAHDGVCGSDWAVCAAGLLPTLFNSKYNAIERYWAGLEKSWNGYLLSTVDTVINRAGNFHWKGMRTMACLVDAIYEKGVKLCSNEKKGLEHRLERSTELNWWDITIQPKPVLL